MKKQQKELHGINKIKKRITRQEKNNIGKTVNKEKLNQDLSKLINVIMVNQKTQNLIQTINC